MINWTYSQWSIREFLHEASTIDCDPEWQRGNVDTLFHTDGVPSKAQSIIASILSGLDIGEIKLCYYNGRRASVDGGNRKRAIIAFKNNDFPLHRKSEWGQVYYRDLDESVRNLFDEYQLRIIQYDELPAKLIGRIFRSTNTVTPVNQQEMRNSYGEDALAVLIRRTVRLIPEIGNPTHPLFDYTVSSKTDEHRYVYLSFNNSRLRMEDQLARIVHRILQGETPGTSTDADLNHMYDTVGPQWEANPAEQFKVERKLKQALDFFLSIATSAKTHRGRGLTIGHFSLLTRLYFFMKTEYGNFVVPNADEFWKHFSTAFEAVLSRRDLVNLPGGKDSNRTVGEAFNGYLSFDLPQSYKHFGALDWFLEEFDPLKVITVRSTKRCFTAKEIEKQLIKQNWKDYIDGKPLLLKNAVGAHKIAYANGGKTTIDNLVVVSAKHNTAMGTMEVDAYKRWYHESLLEMAD